MLARLLAHTLAHIDDNDRGIGAGTSGHHVLEELAVPRRVDNAVVARRRMESDFRGIDGHRLIALGLKGVQHE